LSSQAYRGGTTSANGVSAGRAARAACEGEQILDAAAVDRSLSQVLRNLRDFAATCRNA
jgi:hypothetical protein